MTKQFSNYSDLITFTRASGGHALRPVSYGDELSPNATFTGNIDGWTNVSSAGTVTAENNELKIVTTSTNGAVLNSSITLEVGKIYTVSATSTSATASHMLRMGSTSATSTNILAGTQSSVPKTFTHTFVATSTVLWIYLRVLGAGTVTWDNVSVKEVTFDESDGTLILFEHPDDVPRVEWDSAGNRLGLLVEESRTNLVTYSEDFSNAAWSKTRGDIASVTITDPAGQQNAFSWTSNDFSESYLADNTTISSGATVTFSGFVKKNTADYCHLLVWDASANGCRVWFDLDGGQVGTNTSFGSTFTVSDSSITEYPNGWYRCSMTVTTSGSTTAQARFQMSNSDGVINSSVGKSIYIFGAQVEQASFPTSYIKSNSGSTTTRSADVASIPVADFGFNADEGTVVCQVQHFTTESSTAHAPFGFDDGTSNNRMWYYQNKGQWIGSVSGSTTFSVDATDPTEGVETKVGVTYKKDDFTLYLNGSSIGTDTSSNVPVVDTMGIGRVGASGTELNGHIKSIKYYPRRLTNAQLQDLTS